MQNIFLDGFHLLFEEYLQEKHVTLYPETVQRHRIKKRHLRGGRLVKGIEMFECRIK